MFIDFVALMLINMVAGHFILALFVYKGMNEKDKKNWIPGFAMTGLIALITGLYMTFTWPLPGSYNGPYGDLTAFWGIIFLGAALAMAKDWDLFTVTIYALFAGIASIVIGAGVLHFKMTLMPVLSCIGFILSGLCGVCAYPAYCMKENKNIRILGAVVLILAALIWAFTGYMGYWGHLEGFAKWIPPTMK